MVHILAFQRISLCISLCIFDGCVCVFIYKCICMCCTCVNTCYFHMRIAADDDPCFRLGQTLVGALMLRLQRGNGEGAGLKLHTF